MKLKFYFILLFCYNLSHATYYAEVTRIDPLIGGATYMLNQTPNALQLPVWFCASGNSQPTLATMYRISWYRNTIDASTGGVLISQSDVSTLNQVNISDTKSFLPDTSVFGTFYYYAVLSNPSSTGCGMSDSLTSSTQRIDVQIPATHLNFDGVDDYISVNIGAPNFIENNFTHELWFRTTSPNGSLFTNANTPDGFSPAFNSTIYLENGYLKAYMYNGGPQFIASFSTYNDGNWHHVAHVGTPTEKSLYVDGVLMGTAPSNNVHPTMDYVNFGVSRLSESYFNGDIEDIRIWTQARTIDEITASKYCEMQGNEPGLLAYYKFNQGVDGLDNTAITILSDAIANNNDGTLYNFASTGTSSNWSAGSPVTTGSILPSVPSVTTPVIYAQNDSATELSATSGGTGLMWYSTATEVTGSASAPMPSTETIGSTSYWVASTNGNGCESGRVEIVVNVNAAATHLNFDGVDDWVSINIGASNIQESNYTHELWFQTASATGTLFNNTDIEISNSGQFNKTIYLQNGTINSYVYDGVAHTISSTATYNDGNWHHVAEIVTGTERSLYVDGVLIGTDPHFSGQDLGFITLGASLLTPGIYFNGNIDEVRIWNKVVSIDDINRRQNCELQGSEDDLVAYYKFNEGIDTQDNSAITTLTDAAGNSNDGTLNEFQLSGTSSNWRAGSPIITGSTIPEAPTVTTPITYSEGDDADPLTATSGGVGLLWFTTETGGTGSPTAFTPDTSVIGTTSYWVSSTNDSGCESERMEIVVTVNEVLGIGEVLLLNNIRVYPNPTNGLLTVSNTSTTGLQISVYDINGRLLLNKNFGQDDNTIDISNFSNGMYLLTIKTDLGEISKKVIKN